MEPLARFTFLAMIPLNLLLLMWVWMGRMVFGIGGWMLFILLITVVPIGFVMMALTSGLAFAQPERPFAVRGLQLYAQWAMWLSLFGAGFAMPDFGDTDGSNDSIVTRILGDSETVMNLSLLTAVALLIVAVAAWLALLVAQIVGTRTPAGLPRSAQPFPP